MSDEEDEENGVPAIRNHYNPNRYFYSNFTEYKYVPEAIAEHLEVYKRRLGSSHVRVFPFSNRYYFTFGEPRTNSTTWKKNTEDYINQSPTMVSVARVNKKAKVQERIVTQTREIEDSSPYRSIYEILDQPEISKEQRRVLSHILGDEPLHADGKMPYFSVFRLDGEAGSGKSQIIKYLLQMGIKVTYATTTRLLTETTRRKFSPYGPFRCRTICGLLMDLFSLGPITAMLLGNIAPYVEGTSWDMCKRVLTSGAPKDAKYYWMCLRIAVISGRIKQQLPWVIFIDEYSLLSGSMIGILINAIRETSLCRKAVLIFAGDTNQMGPFFCIDSSSEYDVLNTPKVASIRFTRQHRVLDEDYINFLRELCNTMEPRDMIRDEFQDDCDPLIEYNYPLKIIDSMPGEVSEVQKWFDDNDIGHLVPFIIFVKSNAEIHFYNWSLALMISRGLDRYTTINKKNYINFHIYKIYCRKTPTSMFRSTLPITVLPLVRGFPYKVLAREIDKLPRSSIVYLLDFTKDYVTVYEPSINMVFDIPSMAFEMNLYRPLKLYGFPLQLHVADTFYSAQGLTVTKDIYADLSGASREEAYVILSRVRTRKKCKSIYVPN